MSKQRAVNTKFWSDPWIREELNPLDRYLFLYFLTNEHTNISGVYELPLTTIAFETGLDKEIIEKTMLKRLRPKIIYHRSWVVMPNFPKHQNLKSEDVLKGIKREFEAAPVLVQNEALARGWGDGLGMVPHGLGMTRGTKPNLTKPTVRASARVPEVMEVSETPTLEGELRDSKSPRISGDKLKAYNELIAWSENERGFKFPKTTILIQYKAFKLANENEIPRKRLIEMWEEMATDKFWQKAGFDWMNVVQQCLKKPV
jgi:hypothetical protein